MTATPKIDADGAREQWRLWRAFAADPAVDAEIVALYADLSRRISERGPTCWSSGKCCNFDAYGHKLYVTALEIAWVLSKVELPRPTAAPTSTLPIVSATLAATTGVLSPTGPCVFQIDRLCSIHAVRPLGCRVYFCQEGTQEWQHEVYELLLADLRKMHDRRAIPYVYMEWRAGLIEATGSLRDDRP
ncbi:MAG: YkgJ family cysteine cluster protein [Planctomycetes bacterium]|nr:YkgJ family cysteine cluster protein [Planctomycetota bacterium]